MGDEIRFYFAAKYDKRQGMLPLAAILMLHGHTVQADWLKGTHEGENGSPKQWADIDLSDIDFCTHFVLFNLPVGEPDPSSGRHVEYGYALAKKKTTIVVGGGESIFYEKADLRYKTVDDFLAVFAKGDRL